MNQFGGKRLLAAAIAVLVGVLVIAAIGLNRDMTQEQKVDRNVPGATTGAGKASLTD